MGRKIMDIINFVFNLFLGNKDNSDEFEFDKFDSLKESIFNELEKEYGNRNRMT